MAGRRKKKPATPSGDPLEAYRKLRKPVPPPGRVIADRRRKARDDQSRREMEDPGG